MGMALFFSVINCDHGTWGEEYVCRQNTCIGVKKKLGPLEKKWKTHTECLAECGETKIASAPALLAVAEDSQTEVALTRSHVEGVGRVQVKWRDCSDGKALANVGDYSPSSFPLHGTTKLGGSAILPRNITAGNFTLKLMAGVLGLTLVDMSGDLCEQKSAATMLGLMHIAWDGVQCPLKAGNQSVSVSLTLSRIIPRIIAETTTTVVATTAEGELLFCTEVVTEGKSDAPGYACENDACVEAPGGMSLSVCQEVC